MRFQFTSRGVVSSIAMIAVLVAVFSFPFYSTRRRRRDSLWHGDGPVQRSSPKYECLDQKYRDRDLPGK